MSAITTHYFNTDDMVSAVIYAMALRQLSPQAVPGQFTPHNSHLHGKLNELFEMEPGSYLYKAWDLLLKMVKDELARHGIGTDLASDNEREDMAIALFAKGWALTLTDARA